MRRILSAFGGGLRNGFVAIGALAFLGTVIALADYAATVGSGTNFASIVVGGVHHAAMIVCDATLGEARCATVGSTGSLQIDVTTSSNNLYAALTASIPAGTNVIGKTSVDQTTFGTTNGVVSAANTYNTVAASQTTQALTGGGGGATGDYLSHCVALPTSTSPGVVTILDNAGAVYSFPGGASSLSNLAPFSIPVGAKSTSGAWKVTTGASITVVCVGKFT